MDFEENAWKAAGAVAAMGGAAVARNLAQGMWRSTKKTEPPANPAHPSVSWGEAIMWAALTGAIVGVFRMVAARWAAEGWRAAMGDYPRGLQEVS